MKKLCTNCGEYKLINNRQVAWGCLVGTLLSIPWCFIGIGFFFLIPFAIATLVYFSKGNTFTCKNCKETIKL